MEFSKLKSFFKDNLFNKTDASSNNFEINDEGKPKLESYENWGFKKAMHLNGSHMGLLQCLARIREEHRRMVRQDKIKQNKLKEPLVTKRTTYLKEIEQQIEEKERIETEKIPKLKEKIDTLQKRIIAIKQDPSDILPDKMSRVSFIIGLLILATLSIYLFFIAPLHSQPFLRNLV